MVREHGERQSAQRVEDPVRRQHLPGKCQSGDCWLIFSSVGGGRGRGGSFLTSRELDRCHGHFAEISTEGIKSVLRDSLFPARDAETRRLALFSEPLLSPSPAVQGVVLGAELRHLHRRQVHRDGLRGQEGHRLRGQLLARWRRGDGA